MATPTLDILIGMRTLFFKKVSYIYILYVFKVPLLYNKLLVISQTFFNLLNPYNDIKTTGNNK